MSKIEGNLREAQVIAVRLEEFYDVQPDKVALSPGAGDNLAELKSYCSDFCWPQREKIKGFLGGLCAREALLPGDEDKSAFVKRAGQLACVECAASRLSGGPTPVFQLKSSIRA